VKEDIRRMSDLPGELMIAGHRKLYNVVRYWNNS